MTEEDDLVREGIPIADMLACAAVRLHGLDYHDARSAALEALVAAARSYDGQIPFAAWAQLRMRGAILDEARRWWPVSKRAYRAGRRVEMLRDWDALEMVPDVSEPVDHVLDVSRRYNVVAQALASLPTRERTLIKGSIIDGRNAYVVAQEIGVSKSWASRLINQGLTRLRKQCQRAA